MKPHWIENPSHPGWLLIRWAVVLVTLIVFLSFGYANGWSPRDYATVIGTVGALGVFDVVKKILTVPKMEETEES